MRRVIYVIFNKSNVWIDTTTSYEKAKEYKEEGYIVIDKLEWI